MRAPTLIKMAEGSNFSIYWRKLNGGAGLLPDDETAVKQKFGSRDPARERKPGLRSAEIAFVLLTYVTSVFVLAYSYKSGGIYNDNLTFFGIFRDNAYSLNRFGEPAWWLPHVNFGQPGDVSWALGPQGLSPATVLFAALVWALGAAGVLISDFRYLYVAYLFILLPTIFMGCMWVLSREFRNRYTRLLVFVMGAFSPILIQSVSDPGMVETAAYSLLCIAAIARYIRIGRPKEFFGVVFAFALLLHTLKYTFIFWGVPFLVMLTWAVFGPRSLRKLSTRVLSQESKVRIAFGLAALCIATLPFFTVWRRVRGFDNPLVMGGYDLKDLVPGNPLLPLLVSTPGVNFQWDFYRPSADNLIVQYFPHAFGPSLAFGYAYMGIGALPLILAGIFYGRQAIASRLGILALIAFSMITLAGFSPFYALFGLSFRFILANNHYSDEFFQAGACLIPMFLAVLGFDRIVSGHRAAARLALAALVPITVSSLLLLLYLNRGRPSMFGSVFGFALLISLITAYALHQLAISRTRTHFLRFSRLFVCIMLLDVATVAFWEIRSAVNPKTAVKDLLPTTADSLEVLDRSATAGARKLLVRKEQIPLLRKPIEMKPLAEISNQSGRAAVTRRTFNELTVRTSSPQATKLLIRDAWDPYWTATVNGKAATIERSGIFKSITVPGGSAEIRLKYSPGALKIMLAFSYLALIISGVLSTVWIRRPQRDLA